MPILPFHSVVSLKNSLVLLSVTLPLVAIVGCTRDTSSATVPQPVSAAESGTPPTTDAAAESKSLIPSPAAQLARFVTRPERLETIDQSEFMQLGEDFTFFDAQGIEWVAPKGTKTDGASIPQFFLSLLGDRFDPKYRAAAVVHDAYCQGINQDGNSFHKRKWQEVHGMFYEALRAGGTEKKTAQLMFAAVWLRGPRWNDETRMLDKVPDEVQKEEFAKCQQWLEKEERTNEQLIEWMTKREPQVQQGISPPLLVD